MSQGQEASDDAQEKGPFRTHRGLDTLATFNASILNAVDECTSQSRPCFCRPSPTAAAAAVAEVRVRR